MREVKRCNLLVIICVVSSRAAQSWALVGHSIYPLLKPRLHVQTGLSNYSTFVQTNLKQWLDGQTASVALAMQGLFIWDFLSVCGLSAGSSTNSRQTV